MKTKITKGGGIFGLSSTLEAKRKICDALAENIKFLVYDDGLTQIKIITLTQDDKLYDNLEKYENYIELTNSLQNQLKQAVKNNL